VHELRLNKIHCVVTFSLRPDMLPFISFYNDGQKNMQSDFESSLYKLIANVF